MKKFTIGLSIAALALAGTAYAQQGSRFNPDADGNGVVTRAETQAHASAMFAKLDANKDGKLDKADRETRRQERRTKAFEAMDGDHNGSISRTEFMSFAPAPKAGTDGKPGVDGKTRHMSMRGHHRGHHGGMMMGRMADANKDGAVSKAEFEAGALQRFDAMDANKDGQVTKEERQAHRQEMRSKWQQKKQERKAANAAS